MRARRFDSVIGRPEIRLQLAALWPAPPPPPTE